MRGAVCRGTTVIVKEEIIQLIKAVEYKVSYFICFEIPLLKHRKGKEDNFFLMA